MHSQTDLLCIGLFRTHLDHVMLEELGRGNKAGSQKFICHLQELFFVNIRLEKAPLTCFYSKCYLSLSLGFHKGLKTCKDEAK